ncbi:hypothetical protein [Flavobacterium sp. '19STA2R22 D10 B1']|uniref:hypothetical protein n=1 Tax=Flavobacterium aerium TaxID=3037261 RepID=UPI00278C8627|nr:hypothetical protein [Flavobacterium sp. '19STA2R22 D10 B1']
MKNKKIIIPLMVVAGIIALYEKSQEQSNLWIMIGALVFFMYGMMRLSAATPSKNDENSEDHVE